MQKMFNAMKRGFLAVAAVTVIFSSFQGPAPASAAPRWSNPNMTKEAREVLKYLYNQSGKGILSGQHNYVDAPNDWSNKAAEITGEYPAVWGNDFAWGEVSSMRQSVVDAAIDAWNHGSLVTLSWHAEKPDAPDNAGWWDVQSWYTDEEMLEVVTPGTEKYKQWEKKADEIAGYLGQLQAAGVPVIWRPYHENNAGFFWWGGRPELVKRLWANLYDRFTKVHHLNNLIWNYNTASYNEWSLPVDDFYPGDRYVDMVSVDIYDAFKQSYYEDTLRIANGKPIAIGECGTLPDIELIQTAQPLYTYFLGWGNMLTGSNSYEHINDVYDHPYTTNKDEVKRSVFK
ncbi:hypothetical protein GZH47_17905 [Paenibacillus rhizovicinus]|uniref:GH26 domain-containing protein n=1 Tax=Paenibacillus rhizovicinus TaxID=2704463 RepID=A0A6C0P205_9BACL|nr:glycosyl hydrolase [Paenibacillus rhizovicinus]QHW32499.1 hypothetical protein GZH47_17905 [Paenibacillus rhizovicinus]